MAEFWALRYCGRCIVTTATGPSVWYWTTSSSLMDGLLEVEGCGDPVEPDPGFGERLQGPGPFDVPVQLVLDRVADGAVALDGAAAGGVRGLGGQDDGGVHGPLGVGVVLGRPGRGEHLGGGEVQAQAGVGE